MNTARDGDDETGMIRAGIIWKRGGKFTRVNRVFGVLDANK